MTIAGFFTHRRAVVTAIAATLLVAAPAFAQTASLRLINEYPATSITASADLQFAAAVNKLSNGDIAVATLQEAANPYKGSVWPNNLDAFDQWHFEKFAVKPPQLYQEVAAASGVKPKAKVET